MTNKNGNEPKEEKKSRTLGNGHLPASNSNSKDSSDKEETPKKIGKQYQADVPDLVDASSAQRGSCPERALLVWAPSHSLTDKDMESYLYLAKDKYNYNAEQALGMLFWHRHDLDRATADLANFTPLPDEWTAEDRVLFEQAFMFHGKVFSRIRQMLPDKTIAQLVKHYYFWKKTRQKSSLLDKHCKKHAAQLAAVTMQSKDLDAPNADDSEREGSGEALYSTLGVKEHKLCSNCTIPANFLYSTAKGMQCLTCFTHLRDRGSLRPTVGPLKRDRQLIKNKRHAPAGMYLNHEALMQLASTQPPTAPPTPLPPSSPHPLLQAVEGEVVALKRRVQANKAELSYRRTRVAALGGIAGHRPVQPPVRINAKWSTEELLIAVQAVRRYGRDCAAIAEVVGNKTENHVRSFWATHRKRYSLDDIVREHEQEFGPSPANAKSASGPNGKPGSAPNGKTGNGPNGKSATVAKASSGAAAKAAADSGATESMEVDPAPSTSRG